MLWLLQKVGGPKWEPPVPSGFAKLYHGTGLVVGEPPRRGFLRALFLRRPDGAL